MNKEREVEMLEMFDSGVRVVAIAQEMQVSETAVRNVLKKYGRETGVSRNPVDEEAVIRDYTAEVPTPIILTTHKITYSQLYAILGRNAVPTRKISNADARVRRVETAIEMYLDGAKLWEIANETGIAQPTLHAELHKRGLPLRRAGTGLGNSVDSSRRARK